MSIDEYLSEFDLRHHKLKECKVVLPDAVIACRLLKSCGLSDVHFQLALSTTPKMTFEDMRATLKKLFAESGHLLTGEAAGSPEIVKVEPVLENEALYGSSSRARGRSRRYGMRPTYRGATNYRQDSSILARSNSSTCSRNNPLNPDGSVSICAICSSRMHWAKHCPHAFERQTSSVLYGDDCDQPYYDEHDEEVEITLMAASDASDVKMDSLLGETIGKVLLDSGCSKTVCGEQWLRCYMETLTDPEQKSIRTETSTSVYRFGDGQRMRPHGASYSHVYWPVRL